MAKYYVAGIPFDSENAIQHYGVKGMKWNQHLFGLDANDKYINWFEKAKSNVGKFANKAAANVSNAARNVGNAVGTAVGTAVNRGANFVTGNQARANLDSAIKESNKATVRRMNAEQTYKKDAPKREAQLASKSAQLARGTAEAARKSFESRNPLDYAGKNKDYDTAKNAEKMASQFQRQSDDAKKLARQVDREYREDLRRAQNEEFAKNRAVEKAEREYNRTLPGAVQNAGSKAMGFVDRLVSPVASTVGKAAQDVGNWAGERAAEVGNAVGEAARNVGDWAGDRARDVGNWAGGKIATAVNSPAIKPVADFVTGNKAREDMDDARLENLRAANNMMVYEDETGDITNPEKEADYKTEEAKRFREQASGRSPIDYANKRNDYNTAAELQRQADDASRLANQVNRERREEGRFLANDLRDKELRYEQAKKDYARTFPGAAEKVSYWVNENSRNIGDWVGDRARDVGETVSNVGNWVGDRASDVGSAVSDAAQNVGDAVSGAAKNAGDWIGDRASDVGSAVSGAAQNVGNAVGEATQKALDAAGEAAQNVGNAAKNVGSAVSDAARNARYDVEDWAENAIDTISGKNRARANHNDQMQKYKEMVSSPDISSDDKEQILRDMIAAEDDAVSKGLVTKKDTIFGGPYTSAVLRRNLIGLDRLEKQYRYATPSEKEELIKEMQKLRDENEDIMNIKLKLGINHSSIEEKPDGVSDAFWSNYIAHGGTREQYDNDWAHL